MTAAELVYDEGPVTLYRGDCREVMASLPDNSVDAIVTDPPYELGFMGKKWDSSGIAYDPEVWAQALRVLKPGGHALVFGGTRTWHRVASAVEYAGFEIRDSLAWLYSQGFPKSMDVAKAIEKDRKIHPSEHVCERCGRTLYYCCCGEGWGTALKPAFEPVVMARKPLAGTVAANVLAYGTGALNIDASRIEANDDQLAEKYASVQQAGARANSVYGADARSREGSAPHPAGRFPSNVIFDESQAAALDDQVGVLRGAGNVNPIRRNTKGGYAGGWGTGEFGLHPAMADGGSTAASRFFYVAKAGKDERPMVDGHQHATVKPLTLIRYLVRLITPPGGVVLDPFAGSGTTGEAAILEGFDVTLIELDEDGTHVPLILQRLRKDHQQTLFGALS